jgi:hypothetical protein
MKKVYSFLFVAVVLIASCSSPATDVIPIPKEAAQVVNFNTASLSEKASLSDLFETKLFKKISSEIKDSSILQLFKDPASSGLNTDKNITYFNVFKNNANSIIIGAFIANKDQFEQVVATQIGTPIEGKEYKYATKSNYFVAWNDKVAIQGTAIDMDFTKLGQFDENGDPAALNLTNTISFLDTYFKASGKDLVNDSKHFKEALALGGDIQTYGNTTYAMAPYQMYIGMSKIGDLLKDNYSIGNLSFENGKIVSKTKAFLNDPLKKIFKKHFKNNVNIDPLTKFGGADVIAGFAIELSPSAIVDIIKEAGLDGLVNSYLQKDNLSLENISEAFGNTIFGGITEIISVPSKYYDFEKDAYVESTTSVKSEPVGAFGFEIRNKDYFKKVLNTLQAQGANTTDSLFASDDKLFVVATSSNLANQILTGSKGSLNEYAQKIKNTSGGFFIDFQKLFTQLDKTFVEENDKQGLAAFRKVLKGAYLISEFEGGEIVGHLQLDLMNANENSVKSLINLLDELGAINEANDEMLPPPPPPVEQQ